MTLTVSLGRCAGITFFGIANAHASVLDRVTTGLTDTKVAAKTIIEAAAAVNFELTIAVFIAEAMHPR